MYIYTCVIYYTYIYVYLSLYIYIHIHIHTHKCLRTPSRAGRASVKGVATPPPPWSID